MAELNSSLDALKSSWEDAKMEETEGKEEEEGAEKSTKHIVERLRQEVMSKTKQYMEVGRGGERMKEGRRDKRERKDGEER